MEITSVGVYCGSSPGFRPEYLEAARAFGRLLAGNQLALVYGGGNVGLMGAVADGALRGGGRVVGVITHHLVARELVHRGLSDLRTVETMHERKQVMIDLSDAFVALPGGLGTLEELSEVLTWGQLALHQKPCGILNIKGYFDGLISFLRHMADQRFLKREHLDSLIVESDGDLLLRRIRSYKPVIADKWMDRAVEELESQPQTRTSSPE